MAATEFLLDFRLTMPAVLINPASTLIGTANVVLAGRSVTGYDARFSGPVSIKSVVSGSATWETALGRFELAPRCVLVLNADEPYAVSTAPSQPVETFCLFFARGFVESAFRVLTSSLGELLDEPECFSAVECYQRVHFDGPVTAALEAVRKARDDAGRLDEAFHAAGAALASSRMKETNSGNRLIGARAATRRELRRRVDRGTSFLHANLDRRVTVDEAAAVACLSPFHFHRAFRATHGEAPHRYVRGLRLLRARDILRSSDRSVVETAEACGFDSVTSFTTLFCKTFGVSPGRFRKNGEGR